MGVRGLAAWYRRWQALGAWDGILVIGLFFCLPIEHTPALRASLALLLALRGIQLAWGRGDRIFLIRIWPIIPWLIWASLSYFWSSQPAATLSHLKHDLWIPVAAFLGGYLVFRYRCRSEVLLGAVAAGTFSNTGLTVLGAPSALWPSESASYLFSTVGYASTYALYFVALALPWAVLSPRNSDRYWAIAILSLNGMTAILTHNRMFFLAAAVLLLGLVWSARKAVGRTIVIGVVGLTLAVGIGFALVNESKTERVTAGGGVASGLAHIAQNEIRYQIWLRWLNIVRTDWEHGKGFGREIPGQQLDREAQETLNKLDPFATMHSHNLFIGALAELGVPGLLLLLILLGSFAWQFFFSLPARRLVSTSGLLMIGALVLKNQTDLFMLYGPAVLAYGSIGILLGWLDNQSYS